MRKQFCCDASRDLYETYYLNQSGSGLPIFVGYSGQRGHGLGSMLGGLVRKAMPLLQRGLKSFGKQALKTGMEIVSDVVDGQSPKMAARRRIGQGIKRGVKRGIKHIAREANIRPQIGRGRRRKVRRTKAKKPRLNDIFS